METSGSAMTVGVYVHKAFSRILDRRSVMNAPETIEIMSTVPASSLDRGARRNAAVLVTGANGEVGRGLLTAMHAADQPPDP